MAETRKGEVTFKGNPVELVGPEAQGRATRPPTSPASGAGLAVVKLADTAGKARLFNVVPSLDTPGLQHADAGGSPRSSRRSATRSPPTPSASTCRSPRQRFCTEAKIENLKNLSDVHDHSFGEHYGVLIQGLPIPLLARAVFVVDPSNTITLRRDRPRDRHRAGLRAGPRGAEGGRAGPDGSEPLYGREAAAASTASRRDPTVTVRGASPVSGEGLEPVGRDQVVALEPHAADAGT